MPVLRSRPLAADQSCGGRRKPAPADCVVGPMVELAACEVAIRVIAPDTSLIGHGHATVHLCAVLGGALEETERGRSTTMVQGAVRLSPPGTRDLRVGPGGARCLVVSLPDDVAETAVRFRICSTTHLHDPRLHPALDGLAREMSAPHSPGIVEERVVELMAGFARIVRNQSAGPAPAWLRAVRDRLAEEWRSPPSAQALAEAAGVHRVHLVRAFHDHFGCAPGEFVRRRRVALASDLLRSSELPLAHVAAMAGFADQAHMTRVFRKRGGVTPGALRRYR